MVTSMMNHHDADVVIAMMLTSTIDHDVDVRR